MQAINMIHEKYGIKFETFEIPCLGKKIEIILQKLNNREEMMIGFTDKSNLYIFIETNEGVSSLKMIYGKRGESIVLIQK